MAGSKNDAAVQRIAEMTERLSELSVSAMEIAMGNFDQPIEVREEEDELTEITAALELMRQDLSSMVDALNQQVVKERTIAAQAATIRELSTPVMKIWDEVLILPLIGSLDSDRARQVVENLLDAIVSQGATVAIIDVTGVPVVDTQVANHLLKTVNAAQLLGAQVVLTGLGPQSAQAMIGLGLDLSTLCTKNSLRQGLAFALRETGCEVVRRDEGSS